MRRFLTILMIAALAAGCGGEESTSGGGGSGGSGGEGGGGDAAVLRWTAIPDANAEALKAKYQPISAYLSEALGMEVVYEPVSDYTASVEMFKSGDIQLAWFGGLTGVQARRAVPGAVAIAQGKEDPNYKSYFIAHADTGLEKSDEFPTGIGAFPFAFGSESSTSGRLMPEYFVRQETGKSPQDFFTEGFVFSGAHDTTAEWVQQGTRVKCGVLNYKTYDSMVASGKIDADVCRVVWVTPGYADYNFTAHPRIDGMFGAGTIDKLQQALIDMKDENLLGAFPRSAMISASNEDFANIEKTAKELGLVR